MDKRMLKITITQLRQIALFAVGMSLLTACGNSQSGMKLGDAEFAVMAVNSTTSDQTTSYPATIKGTQDIEVRPQVSGFIVKLCSRIRTLEVEFHTLHLLRQRFLQ